MNHLKLYLTLKEEKCVLENNLRYTNPQTPEEMLALGELFAINTQINALFMSLKMLNIPEKQRGV